MEVFSHELRAAYIRALSDLTYQGVKIPINDEVLTDAPAKIRGAECYIIINNQTENDNTFSFCGHNYLASIQLDVITKYPVNSGGKLLSEQIAAEAVNYIKSNPPIVVGMASWRVKLETQRGLRDDSQTSRIYRKILVFSHQISN